MTSLTSTSSRPGRRAVAPVAATVAAGLLLGGCSFTSRDVTLEPYAPSDGLQVDLGEVLVRNVLVVSEGDGAPGVVSGALVNRGEEDAVVLVEVGPTIDEVDVAAGATVFLSGYDSSFEGGDSVQVVVESVDPIAGGVIPITFSDPVADSATLEVPILLPEGPYAEITPPAGTSADDPSADASTEPTGGLEPSTESTDTSGAEPSGGPVTPGVEPTDS